MSRERNSFQARLAQSEAARAAQVNAARNLLSVQESTPVTTSSRKSERSWSTNAVVAGRLTLLSLMGLGVSACDQLPYWMRNYTESADCRGAASAKYVGSEPTQEVRVSSPTGGLNETMTLEKDKVQTRPVVGIAKIADSGQKIYEVKIEKLQGGKVVEEQIRSVDCGRGIIFTVKDLEVPQ